MERFVIQGSRPLAGAIEVRGAKNTAFPLLAASLLTKEDCVVGNLPLIEDVYRTLEILESMGVEIEWTGARSVRLNTKNADPATIDRNLVFQLRGSVLLFGPLLARFGSVYLPQPGGCVIGARPIDTHLDAFRQLGATITGHRGGFEIAMPKKPAPRREVILNEFSVTATENILLYAALTPGTTTLKIADADYQVQELIGALRQMGASVRLQAPHAVRVVGAKRLKGFARRLSADPIEAGTFILLASAARGTVLVQNVEFHYLELFFKKLRDFGLNLEFRRKKGGGGDVQVSPARGIHIDKIQSFIYPGIHSDLQSALGVLATQAKGSTLLHDPLYEGRLKYLEELNRMGAEIYIADPHRAVINGPTKLYGTDLGTFDLRGGAAMIIAALIAEGKSTISNIYQIDRGYEKIEERLGGIGADIKRVQAAE